MKKMSGGNMKKVNVVQTDLCRNFKCDGASCPSICCTTEWRIYMDRNTYEKYYNIKDAEIRKKVSKYICRNKDNNKSEKFYGIIDSNLKNHICAFLDDKSLCEIQKKFGADYLCKTCRIYPRTITNFSSTNIWRTVDLSCPLVVKQLLESKEKIKLEELEEEVDLNLATEKFPLTDYDFANKYMFDLKRQCLNIIQKEGYDIEEKIILLSMFLKHVEDLMGNNISQTKAEEYYKYEKLFNETDFHKSLDDITVNYKIQFEVLKAIMYTKTQGIISKNLVPYIQEVIDGFTTDETNQDMIIKIEQERYDKSIEEYYKPFMKKYELFFENYYANKIIEKNIPLGKGHKYLTVFIEYLSNYIFMKDLLIGIFANKKRIFTEDELMEFMYKYERGTSHSRTHIEELIKLIEINKFNDIPHLAILIKS